MLARDKRRWTKADIDKDNKITKEEYTAFLHPEEYDHMKDVVVDETLEDIDKDGDGAVSIDEYLGTICCPLLNRVRIVSFAAVICVVMQHFSPLTTA